MTNKELIDKTVEFACKQYDIDEFIVRSKQKDQYTRICRNTIFYIINKYFGIGPVEISRIFKVTRLTVSKGINEIRDSIDNNALIINSVNIIKKKLNDYIEYRKTISNSDLSYSY